MFMAGWVAVTQPAEIDHKMWREAALMKRFWEIILKCNKATLKIKLLLSFVFLILMVCLAGTGGLYYIDRIQGNVNNLTDTASPLYETAGGLIGTMQTTNTLMSIII